MVFNPAIPERGSGGFGMTVLAPACPCQGSLVDG
jgi:hypothetical protein